MIFDTKGEESSAALTSWRPAPLISGSVAAHLLAATSLALLPGRWQWALGLVAINHILLGMSGMWPRSGWLGPNISRLPLSPATSKTVVLTFDDGPDPVVTPRVLDLLDKYDARASFFCIGRRAAQHPEIVREISRRGHDVENHSDTHSNLFACLSLHGLRREIGNAQLRLSDITGTPPRYFRPPMGFRSPLLDPALSSFGLRHVSWTRRGYDTAARTPGRVLQRLTHRLQAGSILMLHDVASSRIEPPIVLAVLPKLLKQISDHGLYTTSLRQALREPGSV